MDSLRKIGRIIQTGVADAGRKIGEKLEPVTEKICEAAKPILGKFTEIKSKIQAEFASSALGRFDFSKLLPGDKFVKSMQSLIQNQTERRASQRIAAAQKDLNVLKDLATGVFGNDPKSRLRDQAKAGFQIKINNIYRDLLQVKDPGMQKKMFDEIDEMQKTLDGLPTAEKQQAGRSFEEYARDWEKEQRL